MLEFVYGDLLKTPVDYIAHQVNCRGVMGAGLAHTIRYKYPGVYDLYRRYCRDYTAIELLGKSFIKNNVISIFGQLDYGRDKDVVYTSYNALKRAFADIHSQLPLSKSIAFPYKFGCGLANGDWSTVVNLIRTCFKGRKIYIVIKGAK